MAGSRSNADITVRHSTYNEVQMENIKKEKNTPLLEMKNINKTFGISNVLKDACFELRAGEVHALMGENGAGKSTLMKCLTGVIRKDSGDIYINGELVNIRNVSDSHKYGISMISQELALTPDMSVADNIFLGREKTRFGFIDKKGTLERSRELIGELGLDIESDMLIKDLPPAKQQLVEIVKAISFGARIVIMDEPTSSLTDRDVEILFGIIRKLKSEGVGIIYITHKMNELDVICDRVTVLCDGRLSGTANAGDVTREQLIKMMTGRDIKSYYPREFLPRGEIAIKCENITYSHAVMDASFEAYHGEIVGFAGLVGSGRTQLMNTIFGMNPSYSGRIFINGKEVSIRSPRDAANNKIAMVPEDRNLLGLFKKHNVKFNTSIKVLDDFIKAPLVNYDREIEITQNYVDLFETQCASLEKEVGPLSGGNQQKIFISRSLTSEPDILILDEPTRGIDVGAKTKIYAVMNELVKQGMCIIMVSSELREIINMSDRIYVMRDGKITGELRHEDATQESIMQLATN